jgi:hypothetical protein
MTGTTILAFRLVGQARHSKALRRRSPGAISDLYSLTGSSTTPGLLSLPLMRTLLMKGDGFRNSFFRTA